MLWSLEIIIFNILASQYQEIQPYSAVYIDSVKIKTSLIMKKECTICTNPWKKAIFETAESICRQFNLISRPASASLKMPWVVNWSLRPLCGPSKFGRQFGLNVAAVSKLEISSKSVLSIGHFPDRETKAARMNSEFRFYFTSCLSQLFTLYRSTMPPPPCPRSAPAFGQHLSIALDPKM